MPETMTCGQCGATFDPADLDAVVYHETHRPVLATGIVGELVAPPSPVAPPGADAGAETQTALVLPGVPPATYLAEFTSALVARIRELEGQVATMQRLAGEPAPYVPTYSTAGGCAAPVAPPGADAGAEETRREVFWSGAGRLEVTPNIGGGVTVIVYAPIPGTDRFDVAARGFSLSDARRIGERLVSMADSLASPPAPPAVETGGVETGEGCVACATPMRRYCPNCDVRPAPPADGGREEEQTGWLVACHDTRRPAAAAMYLGVGGFRGGRQWTADPNRALRFARREDAEAYIAAFHHDMPTARAEEHMWLARRLQGGR